MIWYSLSVSVCAGATVIESPVCTPIGSRFSIEQTMMQLSLLVAHHLHLELFPAEHAIPRSAVRWSARRRGRARRSRSNSSRLYAMPPPVPPSVKRRPDDGRKADASPAPAAPLPCECAMRRARRCRGRSRVIASLNFSRSSALSIASREAPISSTPYFSSTPCVARSSAQFSAVCPPIVGSSASGPLLRDDLLDHLPGDRLDVGGVGHLRVGHDRRRIRVDQHDAIAFLAQRLAGLRAGVVELARLADDDRAGADDQDAT